MCTAHSSCHYSEDTLDAIVHVLTKDWVARLEAQEAVEEVRCVYVCGQRVRLRNAVAHVALRVGDTENFVSEGLLPLMSSRDLI